jgi:hypothetical protein
VGGRERRKKLEGEVESGGGRREDGKRRKKKKTCERRDRS